MPDDVTDTGRTRDNPGSGGTLSLVPDPVLRIRVRPADFARMLGVSRQSVSRWVKRGHVVLGPDGRLDPEAATRSLLRHVDPSRLRARLLRPLAEELDGLRHELELVRGERDQATARARRLARERDELRAANGRQAEELTELRTRVGFLELTREIDDDNQRGYLDD